MSSIKLQRGSPVRRSVMGHRGFYYPDMSGKCMMIRKDCAADVQHGWNDYSGYIAVIVSSEVLLERDQYPDQKEKMIVWVRKNG